jgi:hypothetical protein
VRDVKFGDEGVSYGSVRSYDEAIAVDYKVKT